MLQEVPKALLPVGNRPVVSYVLDLLEQSNLKDIIVVCFINLIVTFNYNSEIWGCNFSPLLVYLIIEV